MGVTEEAIHVIEQQKPKVKDFEKDMEKFKKNIQEMYIDKESTLKDGFSKEFETFKQNFDDYFLCVKQLLKYYVDIVVLKDKNVINNPEAKMKIDLISLHWLDKIRAVSTSLINMMNELDNKFPELKNYIMRVKNDVKKFDDRFQMFSLKIMMFMMQLFF